MAIIKPEIIELLQYRINQEEISSRLYKAMSRWLEMKGFVGAAKLWGKYSEEELDHVKWVDEYLQNLAILPETRKIEEQPKTFKGLPNIVALSYKHEVEILNQCTELYNKALEVGDKMTATLAHKFVEEQNDELGKLQLWIDMFDLYGDTGASLLMIDKEMGKYE